MPALKCLWTSYRIFEEKGFNWDNQDQYLRQTPLKVKKYFCKNNKWNTKRIELDGQLNASSPEILLESHHQFKVNVLFVRDFVIELFRWKILLMLQSVKNVKHLYFSKF